MEAWITRSRLLGPRDEAKLNQLFGRFFDASPREPGAVVETSTAACGDSVHELVQPNRIRALLETQRAPADVEGHLKLGSVEFR